MSSLLLGLPGCGHEEPAYTAVEVKVLPRPRPDASPPTYGQGVTIDPARYEQEERPLCEGDHQPVIVGLTHHAERSSTVWACASGCGPGREYVSEPVSSNRRRSDAWHMALSCVPVCPPATHRADYAAWKTDCVDGPADPEVHRELLREQRAQWAAFREHESNEIVKAALLLDAVDHWPWREDDHQRWLLAATTLRALETTRARLPIPLEPDVGLTKLLKRLHRLAGHETEYTDGLKIAAYEKVCAHECVRLHDACLADCRGGPAEECAACETGERRCAVAVARGKRHRLDFMAYQGAQVRDCGVPPPGPP